MLGAQKRILIVFFPAMDAGNWTQNAARLLMSACLSSVILMLPERGKILQFIKNVTLQYYLDLV